MARPGEGGTFVFDFLPSPASFSRPERIVEASSPDEVPRALSFLDDARRRGFWIAGYVTYEALGPYGNPGETRMRGPLLYFGIFPGPDPVPDSSLPPEESAQYSFRASGQGRLAYANAFAGIKAGLMRGDYYQVNLTDRLPFSFSGNPRALYRRLHDLQPGAYSAFLSHAGRTILSFSPELFLSAKKTDRGWSLETRPIKGTIARDSDPGKDIERAEALREDSKNRAENLMIVDLLRNDLGRIAKRGTVRAPDLFHIESLPLVHHLVSVVKADLDSRYADSFFADALPALFPGGSITGAPKTTAMDAIRALETGPRGIYTGIIGYAGPEDIVFNIAIRTLEISGDGKALFGSGSGIVWDSDCGEEERELALKAAFLAAATDEFRLIETLRVSAGRPVRLLRHFHRLRRSARTFAIPVDWPALFSELRKTLSPDGFARLRITVDREGRPEAERSPIDPGKKPPLRVLLSHERIRSDDAYRAHKTSERRLYDLAFQEKLSQGCDDVLFLNEKGNLAESAIANLIVLHRDGRWISPPVSSGALPGVFLGGLESKRHIDRSNLSPDDLSDVRAAFLCNSVRGMRRIGRIETADGNVIFQAGRESVEIKPAGKSMVVRTDTGHG